MSPFRWLCLVATVANLPLAWAQLDPLLTLVLLFSWPIAALVTIGTVVHWLVGGDMRPARSAGWSGNGRCCPGQRVGSLGRGMQVHSPGCPSGAKFPTPWSYRPRR